jgi:hypothetical protein
MPSTTTLLLLASTILHALLAPFTKVEESFHLQATHDLLFHGRQLALYDHLEFPGVVPRSFAGSLLLAAVSSPFALALKRLDAPKLLVLLVVRCVLACLLTASFARFRRAVRSLETGRRTGVNAPVHSWTARWAPPSGPPSCFSRVRLRRHFDSEPRLRASCPQRSSSTCPST